MIDLVNYVAMVGLVHFITKFEGDRQLRAVAVREAPADPKIEAALAYFSHVYGREARAQLAEIAARNAELASAQPAAYTPGRVVDTRAAKRKRAR